MTSPDPFRTVKIIIWIIAVGCIQTLALRVQPRVGSALAQGATAPRWAPSDISFQGPNSPPDNPFTVPFSATLAGPGGATFKTLGFFDGDNTWKVRVSPTTVGDWTLSTSSELPELDGKTVIFRCVTNTDKNSHGGLRIDSEHPRHFLYEDGTRFFPLGYECDWLWALDTGDENLPTIRPFLDRLAASGFNYLILNTYAYDTSWGPGKTEERDYGPPPLYAWEGSNEQPDHSRFNLAFWKHYDQVIQALHERGIAAHIMMKVYNKKVKWPKQGSAEDELFFRWLVARYAAYPNVIWDFSKEAHNEKDLDYKKARLQLVKDIDPYDRLVTVHDDNEAYESGAYDGLLDYRSDQHHKEWRKKILSQRKQREWPIVNVEFSYEQGVGGPEDKTYNVAQPAEEVARRAWEICMAGGYIAYYYTNTAWDVIHPEETPTGYGYMKNLRTFFETTRYWKLDALDGIMEGGYCLAIASEGEYVVYLGSKDPATIDLSDSTAMLQGKWFHPFTGAWSEPSEFAAEKQALVPPADWGDGPFLLHLKHKEP